VPRGLWKALTGANASPTYTPLPTPGGPTPAQSPRPVAAFVVSLIGGALIFAGALVALYVLAIVVTIGAVIGLSTWFPGLLGLATGPAIMLLAVLFYRAPGHAAVYGSLIIGLSLVSWLSFLGGLFAGLTLGVIGGILILVWRPDSLPVGYYPTLAPYPAFRTCPQCGRAVVADARLCSYCGQTFT
jgi:hypothetical protein